MVINHDIAMGIADMAVARQVQLAHTLGRNRIQPITATLDWIDSIAKANVCVQCIDIDVVHIYQQVATSALGQRRQKFGLQPHSLGIVACRWQVPAQIGGQVFDHEHALQTVLHLVHVGTQHVQGFGRKGNGQQIGRVHGPTLKNTACKACVVADPHGVYALNQPR